jgi:hypothetical protein
MFNGNNLEQATEFFLVGISLLENNQKTNLIPELMQFLTPKQIIILSQLYGGKSLKIPTTKEFSIALKSALYVYQHMVLGMDKEVVKQGLDVTELEFEAMMDSIYAWQKTLQEQPGASMHAMVKKV